MFTQKEMAYLKELSDGEQLCVDKYSMYAQKASNEKLKNLFCSLKQEEEKHLVAINSLQSKPTSQTKPCHVDSSSSNCASYNSQDECYQNDKYLCSDALTSVKHIASVYNTAIFEFRDANVREKLNNMQKTEQCHGKQIYDFMSANNMYS